MTRLLRRALGAGALGLGTLTAMATGAGAEHPPGPPLETFEENDAWVCSPGGDLPPFHCLNQMSATPVVLLVFEGDPRGPQESGSVKPQADTRSCPHDPDATDGTWWEVLPDFWVCHHRP